jgi:MFS family permease
MIGCLRKLVFLVGLLCFAALAVTGFIPWLVFGEQIAGWWLVIHVTAGGVFAGCMAVLAVLSAENNRLDKLGAQVCFWGVLFLSLPVILSPVLSMFKLFGTDWQRLLLQIHRYSTLVLSIFALAYLLLATAVKTEKNG